MEFADHERTGKTPTTSEENLSIGFGAEFFRVFAAHGKNSQEAEPLRLRALGMLARSLSSYQRPEPVRHIDWRTHIDDITGMTRSPDDWTSLRRLQSVVAILESEGASRLACLADGYFLALRLALRPGAAPALPALARRIEELWGASWRIPRHLFPESDEDQLLTQWAERHAQRLDLLPNRIRHRLRTTRSAETSILESIHDPM